MKGDYSMKLDNCISERINKKIFRDGNKCIKLFDEVFCNSTISNKIRITVNDGNKFKPKEEIYSEVIKFIEN